MAPNDINMQFQQTHRRGMCSLCCRVPLLIKNCKAKHQRQYDDSFHVVGARLWNLVPRAIKQKDTLDSFKSALTKFIMLPPDKPPVPGIASENSLLQLLASDRATWRNLVQDGGSTPSDEDSSDEDGLRMA